MRKALIVTLGVGLWLAASDLSVAQGRFEAEILSFEEADARRPPPEDPVLFVGSSSIVGWTSLTEDFPDAAVLNRGFGGSQMSDVIRYAHRIIIPYAPRLIMLYEGDNDLASGKSVDAVIADYRRFVALVRNKLPETSIAIISIKPSLARRHLLDEMREANALLEAYARERDHVDFIDVFDPMMQSDGEPRPELFLDDGLHMNQKGYVIWADAVRPYLERE